MKEGNFALKATVNINNRIYRVSDVNLPYKEAKILVFNLYKQSKDDVLEKFMYFVRANKEVCEAFIKDTLENPAPKLRGRPPKIV